MFTGNLTVLALLPSMPAISHKRFPMQQVRAVVEDEFGQVNDLIIEQLHSKVDMVENIGHYIVDAGGKRLRPMLSLLSAAALGEVSKNHIKLAAVIEFIHTATLLHDDVVDISSLRRGRPTANAEFGNAPSVLVGDFLYSRAFQILVDIGDMPVMKLLSDTTNIVAEGEVLQLTRAGQADTSEATYFEVITSKTAVLFAAACSGAAKLNNNAEAAEKLHAYGLNLGIAFQVVDDALDYEGDPEETGKNVGDDLAEGKPTLPLIYAMQMGSAAQRQIIEQAITNKSAAQLTEIVEIVKSTGAMEACHKLAADYAQKANDALASLPSSDAKAAMERLAELSLQRKS